MDFNSMVYDVAIVGGGPAGSAAAHVLVTQGLRTVVIEQCELPRYKTCGGGLLSRAAHLLPFDIAPIVERCCSQAELNIHETLRFKTTRSRPIIFMTMREDLDYFLLRKSVDCGTELICGCELTAIEPKEDHVQLQTTKGTS